MKCLTSLRFCRDHNWRRRLYQISMFLLEYKSVLNRWRNEFSKMKYTNANRLLCYNIVPSQQTPRLSIKSEFLGVFNDLLLISQWLKMLSFWFMQISSIGKIEKFPIIMCISKTHHVESIKVIWLFRRSSHRILFWWFLFLFGLLFVFLNHNQNNICNQIYQQLAKKKINKPCISSGSE